jgi:hypothetical protein
VSVLPRRSRCCWSVAYAHGREASCYGMTVRGVVIAENSIRAGLADRIS